MFKDFRNKGSWLHSFYRNSFASEQDYFLEQKRRAKKVAGFHSENFSTDTERTVKHYHKSFLPNGDKHFRKEV